MNREETLTWIDVILDSLDNHEMMAIIRESMDDFDDEFFETMDSETQRYLAENDQTTADRLTAIARAIAVVRQNRAENL
jgi:3-oxoacyl-[acyl-carrier-protein] synthase III